MDHGDVAWILTSSALVFIMTPGLAFFYGGLVKRKNAVNTIMSSAILMGLGSVLWVLVGFSLAFSGDVAGIIGDLKWFGLNFDSFADNTLPYPNTLAFAIFQMMFAIITPALITGAVAERMKFSSLVVFVTVWSLIVYYPLAHMVWGGGFLFDIGSVDFAGGNVVHISSGVSALLSGPHRDPVRWSSPSCSASANRARKRITSRSCSSAPRFCGSAGSASTAAAPWPPTSSRSTRS